MSLVLFITSAPTSKPFPVYIGGGGHYPRTRNYGFLQNKKDFSKPLILKIENNPKSRFLKSAKALVHKVCKCCVGFSFVDGKYGAASSFNYNISQFEDNEGINGGSDSIMGSGDGQGNSDSRGGGDNTGNGNGGLDESADWEGLKWWCWRLYETWKNHCQLDNPSAEVTLSRILMPIIKGKIGTIVEPELEAILMPLVAAILMPLLVPLFWPILTLPIVACAGFMVALLVCVVAVLILFREF